MAGINQSSKIKGGRVGGRQVTAAASLLALMFVLWPTTCFGYVLHGPHLLGLMTQKMAGAQSLTVHQHITIEDPSVSDRPIGMIEKLNFLFPDQFRSEIWHENTHRVFVTSRGEALTIVDDRIISDQEGRFDRYKDLLLYRSRKLLHKALLNHGVDVGVTSLGRLDDHIVYIIGAQYPDDSVSQIWIDKVRLLPLRWLSVLPTEGGNLQRDRMEFVYTNWQQLDGVWYPLRIESFYNGKRLRTMQVRRAEANAAIAGELFSISHLISVHAPPAPSESDDGPSTSDADEVERTLEEFRKKFEP